VQEISIGEFSRRSHLSVKALRLYDEIGVLLPARVDKDSGYRYYDAAQFERHELLRCYVSSTFRFRTSK